MKNIKSKLLFFLSKRYGNDALNHFILWLAVTLFLLNLLLGEPFFALVIQILIILNLIRALSSNYHARQKENNLYLLFTRKIRHHFKCIQRRKSDPKNCYYVCPHCDQIVRVPKGRGKVDIRCPKCSHTFEKRS